MLYNINPPPPPSCNEDWIHNQFNIPMRASPPAYHVLQFNEAALVRSSKL